MNKFHVRNHCQPWCGEHKAWLIRMANEHDSIVVIGEHMGRTPVAIFSQMMKMLGHPPITCHAQLVLKFRNHQWTSANMSRDTLTPPALCKFRVVMNNKTHHVSETYEQAEQHAIEMVRQSPYSEVFIFEAIKKIHHPKNPPVIEDL